MRSMTLANTLAFAQAQDLADPLRSFRARFHMPQHAGADALYFTGNSLGLQPKTTRAYLEQELGAWATHGVEGHFMGKSPWLGYHELLTQNMADIVGALPQETIMMNHLTVNLHLLMVSFYRPTAKRFKILCEAKAFPSDQYAVQSQIKFHGFGIDDALVEIEPRAGEHAIRHEDILAAIDRHKDSLALVMLGGVNYFTGQVFDMPGIVQAGRQAGAVVGFDLAHGAGNIILKLHDWQVDFAVWCSYKYLNSGPGGVAGAFIHERHLANTDMPQFAGWWGHDKNTRFLMDKTFVPMETAERWQISNAPVLSMAACRASLDIFAEVGMPALVQKSALLTAYLEFVVGELNRKHADSLQIITPSERRGCQLSIIAHGHGKPLLDKMMAQGIVPDWREPNVIRCAPVPLYNSFEDIWRFGQILDALL
jgi:kynureninase